MNNPDPKKTNPSGCETPKSHNVYDVIPRVVIESSTYTGVDDDNEHSPHWMDLHHDYGGDEE